MNLINHLQKPSINFAIPFGIKRDQCHVDPVTNILKITTHVSPEMAQRWLQNNKSNRPFSSANLRYLRNQVLQQKWIYNSESIKFDRSLGLIDGQHRLQTIVNTGVTLKLDIVIGLDPGAFHTIDTGKVRDGSDVLHTVGHSNSAHLASVARMVISYEKGHAISNWTRQGGTDNKDLIDWCDANPQVGEILKEFLHIHHKGENILTKKIGGSLYYIFAGIDRYLANDFFTKLLTGERLTATSPVYHVRKVLIKDKMSKETTMKNEYKIKYIIKAWNDFRAGKQLKTFRVDMEKEYKIK